MRAENGRILSESYQKPSKINVILTSDGNALVLLVDNIQELEKNIKPTPTKYSIRNNSVSKNQNVKSSESITLYAYEQYFIILPNRNNLKEEIESNFDFYLNQAKKLDFDEVASAVRAERDRLLAEVDWTQMPDVVLPYTKKEAYKEYRQALRDIPEQQKFPYQVDYPIKP